MLSGPVFLRPKEMAYQAVTEDDHYYLVLTEEELASCHMQGASRVFAGTVDGRLSASAVWREEGGSP